MIQAIIFDWDGVIVDSMPSIAQGIQEMAASYGVSLTIDQILDGYFQPRRAYYESVGVVVDDEEELNRRHRLAVHKYKKDPPAFPEVVAVLRFLKNTGCVLAVASTAESIGVLQQLERYGLIDIFPEQLIKASEVPKAEKLAQLVSILGLPKESILYVGDLPSDIIAARKAGILAAGIERREVARKRLEAEKPDFLFSSLLDLQTLIEGQKR